MVTLTGHVDVAAISDSNTVHILIPQ